MMLALGVWFAVILHLSSLSLASVFSGTLGAARRETEAFKNHALFLSALQQSLASLEADTDPYADSPDDRWYVSAVGDAQWRGRVTADIEDESAKFNVNAADGILFRQFFERFKAAESGARLLDWRKDARAGLKSMEEWLLVKGMTPARLESLRPYATVYGAASRPQVNINTVPPAVLEVFVRSVAGADAVKDEFLRKFHGWRAQERPEYFAAAELTPNLVAARLKMPPDAGTQLFLGALLPYLTTDARIFRIRLRISGKEKNYAEAVVAHHPENRPPFDVLAWREN